MPDIRIENEHTFIAAARTELNLFLGAGFPILAHDENGRALPLGAQLHDELLSFFNMPQRRHLDLSQLATILESTDRQRFYDYLMRRFTVGTFDPAYHAIKLLRLAAIFTTNIDDLLFHIFEPRSSSDNPYYLNDVSIHGPTFGNSRSIDLITLHGSIRHPEERLLFSAADLAATFSNDPDRWRYLSHRLSSSPTLFWGYGIHDAGVLQTLHPSTSRREHKDKWIVVRDTSDPIADFCQALGFQLIVSDTATLLMYLNSLTPAQTPPTVAPTATTRRLFPGEAIPPTTEIHLRPVLDFYHGAEPTWSDIYGGNLYKTAHYHWVINSINAGKNTLLVGTPACGKTTLLMQVASALPTPHHKLVCDYLTEERAVSLLNTLDGREAVIFIDNMADNVNAIRMLAECENVILVCAEREYNFDIVSHLVAGCDFNIRDVTELTDRDIQAIFDRIPAAYRRNQMVKPKMEGAENPSIFEFIEANVTLPALGERFRGVIRELESEDPVLSEIFVMTCYVHTCRTPVSFDIVSAFVGVGHVYETLQRLGRLVAECIKSALVDDEQDYFAPRSSFVAEAVLDQAPSDILNRMLRRFHREVSPIRIPRYDVFKRSAYDERLFRNAFRNWKEGEEFYAELLAKDPSPFLKQQAALYLSKKKRFKEAFKWIDEALYDTRRKVPSIRNSHAAILFQANIDVVDRGEEVRRTLDESMKILEDCHDYDKRKTYHAVTFASQALQYWNIYGDDRALVYLRQAERWLKEENRQAPWKRIVRYLLKDVRGVLDR